MKITFFDINANVCKALGNAFSEIKEVSICNQALEELDAHDCLVTSGNSYGIMNGGIDMSFREMFGIELQDALQWAIVDHYGGKLPIGCNILIQVQNSKFANIIYTATMEKPQRIKANDVSIVFYNILKTAVSHNLNTLACCGIGTGTGEIPPDDAATVMYDTYKLFNQFKNEKKHRWLKC